MLKERRSLQDLTVDTAAIRKVVDKHLQIRQHISKRPSYTLSKINFFFVYYILTYDEK